MMTKILPAKLAKPDVPRVYRWTAPIYDVWGRLTESKARDRCLELARIRDGEAVLEVAVGTGLAFAEILKQNPSGRNDGIDLTQEMLDKAIRKAAAACQNNYRLCVGDAYHLKFADASFEALVNNYMFDLLPEDDFGRVLTEFKRVLRPGGRLVLVNMAKGERWHNAIWEAIYKLNATWIGGCRGVSLLEHVQAMGFQDTRREFISQMTFPSEVVYGVKPNGH